MAVSHYTIRVFGVVQGVGFRPFIHRLAESLGVRGTVANRGSCVEIEAEAEEGVLQEFIDRIKEQAPARSAVLGVDALIGSVTGEKQFRIIPSKADSGDVFVSPDLATCPGCLKEMYDPDDRRYRHPFINCTACGPRLTILEGMPYDRVRTSMKAFPMCLSCKEEYTNTSSRRFHAQPVACPSCGPTLRILWEADGRELSSDPALWETRRVIREGGIAAVKGIGGFHLCCDAGRKETVERLRRLKDRPTRPFAVMARGMKTVRTLCEVNSEQEAILRGPQRPILLLPKTSALYETVAPGNPYLGVMLPYAPLHYLLFNDPADPAGNEMPDLLVMTSANLRSCPICHTDAEALSELKPLCDLILTHDRAIRTRADDSVMGWIAGRPAMIRRSRGYAPLPVISGDQGAPSVLAFGGELKNAFALTKGDLIYPSAYLSDMADIRSLNALKESTGLMETLLDIRPAFVAVDSHPGYHVSALGRDIAAERQLPLIEVQHHFAHVVSCMAENDLDEPVIGAACDGTGYGDDGTVWGGEFFRAERTGYKRIAALERVYLAGGDKASREGYRPAVSWLMKAFGDEADEVISRLGFCTEEEKAGQMILTGRSLNGCVTSSAGRLFDAVSSILGICPRSSFEGEAAMALEYAAMRAGSSLTDRQGIDPLIRRIGAPDGLTELSPVPLIRRLVEGKLKGEPEETLALMFHAGMAALIREGCRCVREREGLNKVVLSGGTMQNRLLAELCAGSLKKDGFEVYTHSLIPANDNGLAVGQAAAVAAGYRGTDGAGRIR